MKSLQANLRDKNIVISDGPQNTNSPVWKFSQVHVSAYTRGLASFYSKRKKETMIGTPITQNEIEVEEEEEDSESEDSDKDDQLWNLYIKQLIWDNALPEDMHEKTVTKELFHEVSKKNFQRQSSPSWL